MLQQVQCMVSIKNYLSENLIKQIDKHSFMLSQKSKEYGDEWWHTRDTVKDEEAAQRNAELLEDNHFQPKLNSGFPFILTGRV